MPDRPLLGVRLTDYGVDVRRGLAIARHQGFRVVELDALEGDLAPERLSSTGRRDLARQLASHALALGALNAELHQVTFDDPRSGEWAVERTLAVLDLAADLRAGCVVTRVDCRDPADPAARERIAEVLALLADRADRIGVRVAVKPGNVGLNEVAAELRRRACPSLGACLDSGELIMRGIDMGEAAANLAGLIQWAHVRDAVRGSAGMPGYETAPGAGRLNPLEFLRALQAADYHGTIVLCRRGGVRPIDELEMAKDMWLRSTGAL